jgi:predicted RNase H-like HicB family nuclease
VHRHRVAAVTGADRYIAVYQRDPDTGAWLVAVDGVDGCQTYGRTLRQAGERVREALAAWLDRDPAGLEVDHRWPVEIASVAAEVAASRRAAAEAADSAGRATADAVRRLERIGLSRRDTAEVLGLSHQRVQQLLASSPA